MEKVPKIFLLSVFVFFLLIAGCEDQFFSSPSPSEKKARLIAVENARLEEQISRLNTKFEKCQENLNKSMGKEKEEAAEQMMIDVLSMVGKENAQLRAENEELNLLVTACT